MKKEPTKLFTPADGKPAVARVLFTTANGTPVVARFLDKGEKHVNPISIGGPCNRSNTIKIPATKETVAFFEKEMAKAQHNKMVMDRHGLKPEDMFDEEKLKKHGITTVQNI